MKAIVVGAGVAGLAIRWRLAQRGWAVEVFERRLAGRGATWASAGMIAPGAELDAPDNVLSQFAHAGRAKWSAFAREVEFASGESIDYVESGSLLIAQTAERAEGLRARAAMSAAMGSQSAWLPREVMSEREPLLSVKLQGALYVPGDAHVDNRAFAEALRSACVRSGVTVREHYDVRSILVDQGRARGVETPQGASYADRTILACGAWMNLLGGPGTESFPKIKPVKGQMIACEPPAGVMLPQSLIWGDGVYLVPRRGRLLVGATVEDAGFDTSVSRDAHQLLVDAGSGLIPSLREWPVAEMWAGLRPRSMDDLPVLGPGTIEGLYIASGQFRNGILFAPAVADTLTAMIMGEVVTPAAEAFRPARFAHA